MHALSRRNFISTVAALGVAGKSSAALTKIDTPPLQIAQEGTFPVYLSNERVVVMIRSAGRTPLPVIFDTGTSGNAIDAAVARALELKVVPGRIHRVVDGATGKSFDTHGCIMPDLSIGALKIGDRPVSAYPYNKPDQVGIFGPKLFAGQLVLVDLGASRVRVINKGGAFKPSGPAIPYNGPAGQGTPAVDIVLPTKNGTPSSMPVRADLDSGNNHRLNLPPSFMDSLSFMRPPVVIGQTTSVSGSRDVMGAQIRGDVKIGPITLSNPDVVFDGLRPNVGLPVLKKLRFVLDPQAEQGWLVVPIDLSAAQLRDYVGHYGVRSVALAGGRLTYLRAGGVEQELIALGGDLFDVGTSGVQAQFYRKNGVVRGFIMITADSEMLSYPKTG